MAVSVSVAPHPAAHSESDRMGLYALLREDVQCVFQRDPAARNRTEVLLTYPGVHALVVHRLSHRLWDRGWRFVPRLLAYISRWWTNVDIHPGAEIGRRFFIDHGACVVIGETAEIGNDVTLYHGVTLGGVSWNSGKRHPTLGDGVVAGAGAKILGPITIASGARIGANSVVISDVPEGRTVVGVPGRIVNTGRARSAESGPLDLDHHLIPDPVAEAIQCLLDRIRKLEQASQTLAAEECPNCHAAQLCDALPQPPNGERT